MRISPSLFGCFVLITCTSFAFGQASLFVSEPVLGSPVLLGVDEIQPGTTSVDLAEPVLGSVIPIAAVSDGDSFQITTASVSNLSAPMLMPTLGIAPREIKAGAHSQFDIAISGQGYFRIQLPDGEIRYTRRGSFRLDAEGRLVTTDGHLLKPQIKLPVDAETIAIGSDGVISTGAAEQQSVSNLKPTVAIVRFANPKGLSTKDRIAYAETPESGPPIEGTPGRDGFGTLQLVGNRPIKSDILAEMILKTIMR